MIKILMTIVRPASNIPFPRETLFYPTQQEQDDFIQYEQNTYMNTGMISLGSIAMSADGLTRELIATYSDYAAKNQHDNDPRVLHYRQLRDQYYTNNSMTAVYTPLENTENPAPLENTENSV